MAAFPKWSPTPAAACSAGRTTQNDLADKLAELLRDPIRASQLGLAGQQAVEDRYHAAAMARQTLDLYHQLCSHN